MDKWHKYIKGQAAMEFIILASVLIFMFMVVLAVISYHTSNINKKKEEVTAEDILAKVEKEISIAARVSDGYMRDFMLPQKLGNNELNILIAGDEVIIRTDKRDFWRQIPHVEGSINTGKNTINRTNGTLYLN